jgi:release factor glutamine methyltransferase
VIISEALHEGTRLLRSAGSDEAGLEAELLLMHALKADRVHLYQQLTDELAPPAERRYERLLAKRVAGTPTPYLTGHKEFFGLEFEVSPAALIPRPETETLVELAIAFARRQYATSARYTVADVGVGAGTIAVALTHRLTEARVIAIDISRRALALASRNAERHGVAGRIEFVHGDMLAPLTRPVEIIAANLPYVTSEQWEQAPREIREHEPRMALDGGPDGLRLIRKLLRQAPGNLAPNGAIFAEIGDWQGPEAEFLARRAFPSANVDIAPDLAGRDRVLCVYT